MASMYLSIGTGRAKCRLCGEKILKGQHCIHASGYSFSTQCHARKEDCKALREVI